MFAYPGIYRASPTHIPARVRVPFLHFLRAARLVTDSLKVAPDLPGSSKVGDDPPWHSTHMRKLKGARP